MIDDLVRTPWHGLALLAILCTAVSIIRGLRTLQRIPVAEPTSNVHVLFPPDEAA